MKIKLKKIAQMSVLLSLISLGNNTVYAVSCWKGACIIKQDDTLLQIAQEMEKSTRAVTASKPQEQPRDIEPENTGAVAEKAPQIEYEKDDLFDFQEEDDLLWQSDTQFDEPEYQSSATDGSVDQPADKTETAFISNPSATKKTYTVKVGDTLFSVMRNNKVHWRVLAQLNHLKSPYSLTVGQIIKLSSD